MSKIRDASNGYNHTNILGPVEVLSGVPTAAIIERGSNANGEYTKYADGTLECFSAAVTLTTGGVTVTYPAVFAGPVPRPVVTAESASAAIATTSAQGQTNFLAHAFNLSGQRIALGVAWSAKGRWF